MKKKILVGLDEGEFLGISIFDLSGNMLNSASIRAYDRESLENYIRKFGEPVAISIIDGKIPSVAEFLARKFEVPIVFPEERISQREITVNTRRYEYKTDEEKYAIYASLYVFKKFKKEFKELEEILRNMGQEKYLDYAKELIIRGDVENVFQAVEKSVKLPIEEKKREERRLRTECEERYRKLVEYVKELEKRLEEYEKIEKEVSLLSVSGSTEEEFKRLKRELIKMEEDLETERHLRKLAEEKLFVLQEKKLVERQGLIPVPRIKEFSMEEISNVKNKIKITGNIVVVESDLNDEKTASYLINLKPKIVIAELEKTRDNIKSLFVKHGIMLIDLNEVEKLGEIEKFNRFYGLKPEFLKDIEEKGKNKGLVEWLRAYRKRHI